MLTIGLDESGQFKCDSEISFVAGILYKGEDYKEEELRLRKLFLEIHGKIEKKFNLKDSFPRLLHSTENKREINAVIEEEVIRYLKKNKNYTLTAFIKDSETYINNNYISNLINMKEETNIYTIMANLFIYNNVFYSLKEEKDINLNLATRSIPVFENNKIKKFIEKGYMKREIKDGFRFYITNSDTYRAAITEKLMGEFNEEKYHFNINVEMINYDINNNKQGESSSYLYLADAICKYLRGYLKNNRIEDCIDIVKRETECNVEVFYYTDIHFEWIKLSRGLKERDIIKVLEQGYKIKNSNDKKAKFYYRTWVKKAINKIENIFEEDKFNIYYEKIKYLLSTKGCDYSLAEYILEKITNIVEKKDMKENTKNKMLFKLYSCNLAIYNHKGCIDKGQILLEKIKEIREYGDINEYMEVLNRSANIELNACDYESAIEKLKDIELYYEEILKAYECVKDLEEIKYLNLSVNKSLGKVKSTIGQAYSFNKDYEKGERYFKEAENLFEEIEEKNRVKNYRAHLYLDNKKVLEFKECIKEIYQIDNLSEILINLSKEERIDRFKVYLILKGLNELEDADPEIIVKLLRNKEFKEKLKLNSHPGELISKYICLILLRSNNNKIKMVGIKLLEETYKNMQDISFTIKLIMLKAQLEINKKENLDIKEIKKAILEVKKEIKLNEKTKKIFKTTLEMDENKFEEIYQDLNEKIIYTYN